MSTPVDLLTAYESAPSLVEAESALDRLGEVGASDVPLGDLYDELAELASEEDDLPLAIRAQRRAIELGCRMPELAREMLAWYLLKDGQIDAGEGIFAELVAERPDDTELLIVIGNARYDAGAHHAGLSAFDEALIVAKRSGEPRLLERARAERWGCREELGLAPDEDDRLAPRFHLDAPVEWALGWFPRDQRKAALSRWPDLEEDLADADEYCRRIERDLRAMHGAFGRRPTIAPLRVEALVAFAAREGLDPEDGHARSRYAAEEARSGHTLVWPPGRNEPCWCGSGRKYKRCCATT